MNSSSPSYVIGIDLGTSHTVVAYAPLTGTGDEIALLTIPQRSSAGEIQAQTLLPSVRYQAAAGELGDAWQQPWPPQGASDAAPAVVGRWARDLGTAVPNRLVASAKSWLSHTGVDRSAAILPWGAGDEVAKISPLAASASYLAHVKAAWEQAHPEAPLDAQIVVLTVPASFDEGARALTLEAAQLAGLPQVHLLEEPKAAFHDWLVLQGEQLAARLADSRLVLVVDVGGGTTDLTLIQVESAADGGLPSLTRTAVGEHLMLGGDNMDLALAYAVARKLAQEGKQLDAWQTRALAHGCRAAKEQLLSDAALESVPVVVPSRGSKLIGGSIRTEVTRSEVLATLVEGFFPQVAVSDKPISRARGALTQLGLPYAQDAAVTRHLAAFLSRQAGVTEQIDGLQGTQPEGASFLHPTAILFNGGVLKAPQIEQRITQVLNSWLAAEGAAPARLLDGANLDLAVARGAAYYGHVREGRGVRIRGGTAQSYYVGVESNMPAIPGMEPPMSALCLAPFGMEEGSEAALDTQEFGLVVGEPVRMRFFGSSVRRSDTVGTMLDFWGPEELLELQEIELNLPAEGRANGEVVPVTLHARVTDIGTLELNAVPVGGSERWKVEFDVRAQAAAEQ